MTLPEGISTTPSVTLARRVDEQLMDFVQKLLEWGDKWGSQVDMDMVKQDLGLSENRVYPQ